MTSLFVVGIGGVVGVVARRDSTAVATIEIVAINPSVAVRRAFLIGLTWHTGLADALLLVNLDNDMGTTEDQPVVHTDSVRRGRQGEPAWAYRLLLLLLRGRVKPEQRALERLGDDLGPFGPADELSAG